MYSKKQTEIITFLLTWLLTYDSAAAAAASPTVGPRIRTSDPCAMVVQFAKDEAAFSMCAITSGNNMCQKCVSQIRMLTDSYTKLMAEDSIRRINDSQCLESVHTDTPHERYYGYYMHSRSTWITNNCDNCYMDSTVQLRRDVASFYIEASDFTSCMARSANDTCASCKDVYSSLNRWYEQLDDDYQGNVCLDVTAVMTTFRSQWFSLGCISPLAYDLIVIIIGGVVIFACLLMYLISRKFARMDRPGLLTQKRLSTMFTEPKPINSTTDERTHLLSGVVIP